VGYGTTDYCIYLLSLDSGVPHIHRIFLSEAISSDKTSLYYVSCH